ncbi:glycosyltransferase [Homoserinibacter gongjuensis]|uniref:Glycosyl transferase n=1 Tax=Homoserinibacter gongjuensis TaxID=1162968 RepID=A0ABQ6JSH0_9MICO|nr:glycosyltransferase [Homoserinibacter gongjuensis]GMA90019.1 glycosyl transferase [Homoserinibacter gongjuensis]
MRVVIATRIFGPEVSAASAILRTWAEEFRDRGCEVTVVTARPPRGAVIDDPRGIEIRRARVKRDKQQYVRGYLSYMSFDIPLAFRLLFSRKADLYVVEPPPTTVAVVRVIAALRRTPYVVRAADYWTEAAELVTDNRFIIGTLKRLEAWGLRGARMLFAAHEPLMQRFREVGIDTPAVPIGFGADTKDFRYDEQPPAEPPVFVYAGTHSEWHGAGIFVEAMPVVLERHPDARLEFYGNGEERGAMLTRARELGVETAVEFHGPIPPVALSPILAGATASVASLAPVAPNEYALATKVYSSLAAGCPVIFTGVGPTIAFLDDAGHPRAGVAVPYDVDATAAAMIAAADAPVQPPERAALARWSADEFSLAAIAQRVVDESLAIADA